MKKGVRIRGLRTRITTVAIRIMIDTLSLTGKIVRNRIQVLQNTRLHDRNGEPQLLPKRGRLSTLSVINGRL